MPRKAKGIHTSPEKAGADNLSKQYVEKNKDPDKMMKDLMPVWNKGFENRENYKGQWTEETMAHEINEFFKYCFDNEIKPAKVGLGLWLGTVKQTIWEWETKPQHGFKHELIKRACELIELSYIGRLESYPTGNMFLLKSLHGHSEVTKVEVTNNTNVEDVKDMISKLGLDKTPEQK